MVQLPLFQPNTTWTAPDLNRLPDWKGARRVAIDIETRDPDLTKRNGGKGLGPGVRRNGYITGVSFSIEAQGATLASLEDAPAFYLPIAHEGGGNLCKEDVFRYLRAQAGEFRGDIVGANLQYDLDYLLHQDVEFNPRFFRDVQVAEPVLDELHWSFSLDAIAQRNGLEGKNEAHLVQAAKMFGVDPKAEMWKLPAKHVGAYAEIDARLPLRLINIQERRIQQADLDDPVGGATLWDMYNLESRVLPVLLRMRRRGVRIDYDQLDKVQALCIRNAEDAIAEMSRITMCNISIKDINRPAVLGPALESVIGTMPKTAKGQVQLNKDTFKAFNHPALNALTTARQFWKVATDFVSSVRDHAVNGRVHCTFNQLKRESDDGNGEKGAGSGRLSSSAFNLQQQPNPKKSVVGKDWRAVFLPDEGGEWACLDFSQQEPRWLVHFAELSRCRGGADAAEKYRNDPSTDSHDMTTIMIHGQEAWDSWSKEEKAKHRDSAKTIYLARCYGMGDGKLCRGLGLDTIWRESRNGRKYEAAGEEGQAFIDLFNARVPYISQLSAKAVEAAKSKGYIKTILGRRIHFEKSKDGSDEYIFTHAALNNLVQGSSADQTKKAMVQADDEGIEMQLQVHDEIDLTIYERETAERLAEIMGAAVPCNVPHKVDIEIGPDWGHIK